MSSVVCTLFEKNYHYGVASLINSLYNHGFRGDFYAGYKGELPFWAADAKETKLEGIGNCRTIQINDDLHIHFVLVETDFHLTNYKPSFMLQLLTGPAKNNDGIFYFDPDIVNKCEWTFYERWITYGVAIVQEVVANHVSPNHPKRMRWKEVIEKSGRKVERNLSNYFNGGFCGIKTEDIDFLYTYQDMITVGIAHFDFDTHYFSKKVIQTNFFPVGDQDALNIAAMCCKPAVSDFGPEGMDFTGGGWLMSHATGAPKPWNKKFLTDALQGKKISSAEKIYWYSENRPIVTYSNTQLSIKRLSIKIASFINRFYIRN